jgi:hypothetical protein
MEVFCKRKDKETISIIPGITDLLHQKRGLQSAMMAMKELLFLSCLCQTLVFLLGIFRSAPRPSDTSGRHCALLLPRWRPATLKKKKRFVLVLFFKFTGNL